MRMKQRLDSETRHHKLCHVVASAAEDGQPELLFRALDETLRSVIGHHLFTLLVIDEKSSEAQRVYSNDSENFPVGGRKQMAKRLGPNGRSAGAAVGSDIMQRTCAGPIPTTN